MWTFTVSKILDSGSDLVGNCPQSKARATELPIHFCGTGTWRQETARSARRRTVSRSTSSATSSGARSRSRASPPGSAGVWCTSRKCIMTSAPVIRWSMMRNAFFIALSLPPPKSISGFIVLRLSGAPSKPSSLKPSHVELVTPSTRAWRMEADFDLPCQPAEAVFCPIFRSSKRRVTQPSWRFRSTSKSLRWSFNSSSATLQVTMPAYSNMKLRIGPKPPPLGCFGSAARACS
mmetsp:Transcript_24825/g.78175  ORF Transcript_24825/g.78175 Transcript_24825/m.78175 type:complete len:234 (-) Transcript_24825:833-1534(-)